MNDLPEPSTLIALLMAAALLLWCVRRRRVVRSEAVAVAERLDTQLGWSPQATRILRGHERVAFGVLSAAFPECLILAQVPIARFISVPRKNSRVEWMRRLGSQCVDFAICDQSSRVVGVVEVRPSALALADGLARRVERVTRALEAVRIPVHVWDEGALPTPAAARSSITARWDPPASHGAEAGG